MGPRPPSGIGAGTFARSPPPCLFGIPDENPMFAICTLETGSPLSSLAVSRVGMRPPILGAGWVLAFGCRMGALEKPTLAADAVDGGSRFDLVVLGMRPPIILYDEYTFFLKTIFHIHYFTQV